MNSRIYKVCIGVLLVVALTGFGTMALAQQGKGPRGDRGPRGGCGAGFWSQLTEEQRTQLTDLRDKYRDESQSLHQTVRQKRLELRSEVAKQAPDAEKAQQLQKEISDVQAQLAQERIKFVLEAKKIIPEADKFFLGKGPRFGRGGKGPKGYGGGQGHGRPNGPGSDCPYL